MMDTLKNDLLRHPFFKELSAEHFDIILRNTQLLNFDAGERIFKEDEEANTFYIIKDGKVAIELFTPRRGHVCMQTLGENELLGWSALISPYRREFDGCCVEKSHIIAIDGKILRQEMDENPRFGYELLKRFSYIVVRRLKQSRLQLADLYGASS